MIHVSSQLLSIWGVLMINKKMQKMHRLSGPCWQACCLLAGRAHLAKARHCSQETIHQLIIKNNYHNDNIGNNKDNDY